MLTILDIPAPLFKNLLCFPYHQTILFTQHPEMMTFTLLGFRLANKPFPGGLPTILIETDSLDIGSG